MNSFDKCIKDRIHATWDELLLPSSCPDNKLDRPRLISEKPDWSIRHECALPPCTTLPAHYLPGYEIPDRGDGRDECAVLREFVTVVPE